MWGRIWIAFVLLLACACTACVQVEMLSEIDQRGGGTFSAKFALSPAAEQAIEELRTVAPQMAKDYETPADYDRETFARACQEHGVELERFDQTSNSFDLEVAFPSIEALSNVMVALADPGEEADAPMLYRLENGDYHLTYIKRRVPAGDGAAEGGSAGEEAAAADGPPSQQEIQKAMGIMQRMMSEIDKLSIVMKMTLPGEIKRHNAQRVEGRTAIWEINASNFMELQGSGADDWTPDIVFSGEGLSIPAPPAP